MSLGKVFGTTALYLTTLFSNLNASEPSIVKEAEKQFEIPIEVVAANGMKFVTEETIDDLINNYSSTTKPFQESFNLYQNFMFIKDFKIGEVSVSEENSVVVNIDIPGLEKRSYSFSQPTDTTNLEKRMYDPEQYESLIKDGFVQLLNYTGTRAAKEAIEDSSKKISGMTLVQAVNTGLSGNIDDINTVVLLGEQYDLENRLKAYLIDADKNLWLYTANWDVSQGEEKVHFNYCAVMGVLENNRFLPIYGEIGLSVLGFNIEPFACLSKKEKVKTHLASLF